MKGEMELDGRGMREGTDTACRSNWSASNAYACNLCYDLCSITAETAHEGK